MYYIRYHALSFIYGSTVYYICYHSDVDAGNPTRSEAHILFRNATSALNHETHAKEVNSIVFRNSEVRADPIKSIKCFSHKFLKLKFEPVSLKKNENLVRRVTKS